MQTRNPELKIGLVGPMSNYAAPPQLVENVPYQNLDEMQALRGCGARSTADNGLQCASFSGFCLLMKRAVYETIGGLDERFGLGFFDDDDLAERARRAGFELAVAYDLFVHHFGSRTFVGNGVDSQRVLDENAARFAAKWGNTVPRGVRVALRPFTENSQNGHERTEVTPISPTGAVEYEAGQRSRRTLDAARPAIHDSERSRSGGFAAATSAIICVRCGQIRCRFARCRSRSRFADHDRAGRGTNLCVRLESVRGLFDEVVIVDTGSKDRTIEIARSFGARVFDFVWVDDFAAARNAALARARGDYAFWLDADDLIESPRTREAGRAAGEAAGCGEGFTQRGTGTDVHGRSQSPLASAYVVRCACDPGPDGSGGDTVVDHIRLFPLIEGVRWTYRVHEQILPALKHAGVPVQWTDITVRHTGYADRALRSRKLDRDCRILREELAERPDDAFTLFNLGSVAIERAEWNDALEYLRQSLGRSAPTDSITRKLFALIARAHQMKGDFPSVLRSSAEG